MKIIGSSGVSIFLAAQVMRKYSPTIYLKDTELVNNHSAVLRFKTDEISKFLNIPFKKVNVDKVIYYKGKFLNGSNLVLQNMYSQKVTGKILDRSIRDISPSVRYIAPDNLFELISSGFNIVYGINPVEELFRSEDSSEIKLSYVKMPLVAEKLDLDIPFKYYPVWTLNATIESPEVDVYQTIYYPGSEIQYRASITKNQLIVELVDSLPVGAHENLMRMIIEDHFRIKNAHLKDIKYNVLPVGKMAPISEYDRKCLIRQLTVNNNIYSFGRNGIWKSIRLDQLFEDLMKIDRHICSGGYGLN